MKTTDFDKTMTAVTFAEAGEADTAREFLKDEDVRAHSPEPQKKKPWGKTLVFGAISLTGYVILFKNEKLVTEVFTQGGWHTVFPVITALFFSFVHGAFGSNLLSALGLEAKK